MCAGLGVLDALVCGLGRGRRAAGRFLGFQKVIKSIVDALLGRGLYLGPSGDEIAMARWFTGCARPLLHRPPGP